MLGFTRLITKHSNNISKWFTSPIKKGDTLTPIIKFNEIKPYSLVSDTFEQSKKTLKVFNSTIIPKKGIHLVSPEFNGCHGVVITTKNEVFMTHFPPCMPERLKKSISDGVKALKDKTKAKVFYITPTDSLGQIPKEFDFYTKLIKKEINNLDIEHLRYPNRSKGKTYTFEILENGNGNIIPHLYAVKR